MAQPAVRRALRRAGAAVTLGCALSGCARAASAVAHHRGSPRGTSTPTPRRAARGQHEAGGALPTAGGAGATTTSSAPATRTTGAPPPSSAATPAPRSSAAPPWPATGATHLPGQAGAGLVAGEVTALGDSVMLDYASVLVGDLRARRVVVRARVGEQFSTGATVAAELRATRQLGTIVVVALGTNGPITTEQMAAMRRALAGASLVVFVTVHVDQPWQGEVNATLRAAAAAMPHAVIADWARLSATHPSWFYADGTHLPIDGPGAHALAALIARAIATRASD
ncbi:MAG: hypothetical protein M0004_15460 [Actinomycetota bacterium]|nr:hypothetical protein [Actinomycetota bacterium]